MHYAHLSLSHLALIGTLLMALSTSMPAREAGAQGDPGSPAIKSPTFKEVSGVVAIPCDRYAKAVHARKSHFYTGMGITALSSGREPFYAEYPIEVSGTGRYRLFILGCRKPGTPVEGTTVSVQLSLNGKDFTEQDQVLFNDLNATSWTSRSLVKSDGAASMTFEKPGGYVLRLAALKGEGFFLEKVVLSRGGYIPTGTGPGQARAGGEGPDPMVIMPPQWAFGVLYGGYTDEKETREAIDRLIGEDYPIDAYWIDSWFWNFRNKGAGPEGYLSFLEDREAFPHLEEMWRYFEQQNVKAGIWIWDCILRPGNEATFDQFNGRGFFSGTYVEKGRWHNKTGNSLCGNIDFSNPGAVAYWKLKLKPFFDKGLDFLKLDRSSAIPYCKAAFEAAGELGRETKGRGFILAHLHTIHDARHRLYPTRWTGDARICWSQPDYPDFSRYAMGGLKENIAMVADPKRTTYEVPFLTHDGGGYDLFGSTDAGDELYARWVQFASMNTIMTLFSAQSNVTRNHPFLYSPRTGAIARKYTHLRMRLFPYIYSYALNTRLTGHKMIQGIDGHDGQYLFGRELLVAPVTAPGATTKEVCLPEGEWIDFETEAVHRGGKTAVIDAPLEKLPILVRGGAIIPSRDYARSIERGTNGRLTLDIYPTEPHSRFVLREDDGTSNDYLKGGYASTPCEVKKSEVGIELRIGAIQGRYATMCRERQWVVNMHLLDRPRRVTINGIEAVYTYDPEKKLVSFQCEGPTDRPLAVTVIPGPNNLDTMR